MGHNTKKVNKWREKMGQYRTYVTRDKFTADLRRAGFLVVEDHKNVKQNRKK